MASEVISLNPNALQITIEFLTAMITPALLISATVHWFYRLRQGSGASLTACVIWNSGLPN
jgi:hypothetical protein